MQPTDFNQCLLYARHKERYRGLAWAHDDETDRLPALTNQMLRGLGKSRPERSLPGGDCREVERAAAPEERICHSPLADYFKKSEDEIPSRRLSCCVTSLKFLNLSEPVFSFIIRR